MTLAIHSPAPDVISGGNAAAPRQAAVETALLTGGFDRPYVFGLTMALAANRVGVDVVGSTEVEAPEMHTTPELRFLNVYGDPRQQASAFRKAARIFGYYLRLLRYAATAEPRIFHILWNNKFQFFDRTLLTLYYKLVGKRIVLTAHNVNAGKRDGNDSFLNRLTLKAQYHLADHIFVHTELMKRQLLEEFGVAPGAVTVIPFGINNSVPNTSLTRLEARRRLGVGSHARTILFFGSIRPYKGLDRLVDAFLKLAESGEDFRLIIAGDGRKDCEGYLEEILHRIESHPCGAQVISRTEYIPDADTELYFKAADVLVLPYVQIFQSGVLFLSYFFGLPVVAADIGSFREDVIEGETGVLYNPDEPEALTAALQAYFAGSLYRELDDRRQEIRDRAERTHSWNAVGHTTRLVYEGLLRKKSVGA